MRHMKHHFALEATEGVHFERAWLDPESGKVFYRTTTDGELS